MDAEPLPFLFPSGPMVERLRALIEAESGIILAPDEALRFGTFLLQATVLLAEPRPTKGSAGEVPAPTA